MRNESGVENTAIGDAFRSAIKNRRKQLKMTQREVAKRAGMSQSFYTEIEGGKKHFNEERASAICGALNLKFTFGTEGHAALPYAASKVDEFLEPFPEDIKDFLQTMRSVFGNGARMIAITDEEGSVLRDSLNLFGNLYGSDRPKDAKLAERLANRISG